MVHPLDELDFSKRVAKRAQYEAFAFSIAGDCVRVRNESHADPDDHEYLVTVDGTTPTRCTCPADEHFEGACKHRVAVAIRVPVREAASTAATRAVATDGGVARAQTTIEDVGALDEADDEEDDECEDCLEDCPCWECFRTGKREFPD